MDNKEKFIILWEEAGGVNAERGILKKIAKKLKVPEGTARRWKSEYLKKNKMNVQRTNEKSERSENANDGEKISLVEEIIDPVLEDVTATKSYKIFTGKEKMFVTYYFLHKFNIKAASLAAGYSDEREGSRVLRKPKIQKVIRRIKQIIIEKAGLDFSKEELLEELFINLKKATGEIPQIKTFIINKSERRTRPAALRLFEGKLQDGTEVHGREIEGIVEKGSFRDVGKNNVDEISWQAPEEFLIRDTDLKEVNNTIKTISSFFEHTSYSQQSREKINLDRQKYLLEKKKAGLMLTPEEEAEIEENIDLYEQMMGDRE